MQGLELNHLHRQQELAGLVNGTERSPQKSSLSCVVVHSVHGNLLVKVISDRLKVELVSLKANVM